MLCKKYYKTGRVVILCYLTKELVFKPIKLNVAFKYDFKCYSETNFGHMEYIFDLDTKYTSSLGENLKKLEIIEYTYCMHINSIIPETKSMHLLYLYSNASCSKVWPNDM